MDETPRQYQLWLKKAVADQDIQKELKAMATEPDKLEDAFYRNLAFGTGGLRGIIGAGTNRMNVYTVAKASQGLADYINLHAFPGKNENQPLGSEDLEAPRIAVSYDSRIKSRLFAQTACRVFAANGLDVFLYKDLMPTPCLSFAVRELGCAAGVMITASHNPSAYNGYKVYGADGCQITSKTAKAILEEIEKLDIFSHIKGMPEAADDVGEALDYPQEPDHPQEPGPSQDRVLEPDGLFSHGGPGKGIVQYIPDKVYTAFVEAVKSQSFSDDSQKKNLSVVYSPLNGTGLHPVLRTLSEKGYKNITVVEEQKEPDGNFPTCPYPNPEVQEAMDLGIRYARKQGADLVLATDPDCDRVGIAARDPDRDYRLLSGNETGVLLLDYVCSRRTALGLMPKNPVFMKTIVTTGMAEAIASRWGVSTVNVLTGFKFIGEKLGELENEDRLDSFIFAFEESYGYLSGPYVRDKDGVAASLLICEMADFYKAQGITLADKLEELYQTFGYCLDTQHCCHFEGPRGAAQMKQLMEKLRRDIHCLGGKKVIKFLDYQDGLDNLPKSNVVQFLLEDHCSVVARPSGTEPKIKVYVSVRGENPAEAKETEERISSDIGSFVKREREA